MNKQYKHATFAGGCFWCMVQPFDERPGIKEVISGYTGGELEHPTYKQVSTNTTGHFEAVDIVYDPEIVSYGNLVETFWQQIDPTDADGQFNDRGESYQTAIFYHDDEQKNIAEASRENLIKSGKFSKPIATKILPAKTFYRAEEAHQDYHKKNSLHYSAYRKGSGREDFINENWKQPVYDQTELKEKLTPIQYHVTRENGTERPFENEYWDTDEAGIYVDIISGKVLFSSHDKFDANCGWPSFTKPIDSHEVSEHFDTTHGMRRTEVRSVNADSHLGHVFPDGPKEHGGLRYCINSAAVRFVPQHEMKEEGYESYLHLFN